MADMQEKEYYLDLGRKFKILRKRVGKTTEEVAEEIGVDRAMIAQFENYGKKISAYRINQLFKVFGFEPIETNLDEVLSGQKKNPISIPLIKSQLLRAGGGALTRLAVMTPAAEQPTVERLHQHIEELGFRRAGKHHEIYLSDFRKASPEKLKTIIRQPMER